MTNEHQPHLHPEDEPLDQFEYANRRLSDELAAARSDFAPLSDESLRALAAHVMTPTTRDSSAINRLATGQRVTLDELTPEGLTIASDPRTAPTVRSALDWIGTTLLLREHPDLELPSLPISFVETSHVLVTDQLEFGDETIVFRRRAGLPTFYRLLLEERLTRFLGSHGNALRAYLSLSDVDADDRDLLERLQRDYLGNYDDVVDAITTITPYFQWMTDLSSWAEARGLRDLVDIDHDGLTDRAYEWWRVGEVKGRTYVFSR